MAAAQTVGWVVYVPYPPEVYPPGSSQARAQIIDFNHRQGTNIALPGRPVSVTVAASGRAYVGNRDGSIGVYDASTGAGITTIPLTGIPWSIAISPDGATAYAGQSASVAVIDTATDSVVDTIPVCADPLALAVTPDGSEVYDVNTDCGVTVIDTATNTVSTTIPVGTHPRRLALTPDGAFAYVVDPGTSTVSVIDTSAHAITASIPVLSFADAIAITPDGTYASLLHHTPTYGGGEKTVSLISTATNTVSSTSYWQTSILQDTAITPDGSLQVIVSGGAFFEWKGVFTLLEQAAFTVGPVVSGPVSQYDLGTPNELGAVSIARIGPCGDGVVVFPEQCEDGNLYDGDGCDPDCMLPGCGNSYVDAGEDCDDGNLIACDGCSADCEREVGYVCGDGTSLPACGEQCDDGNLASGDCCNAACQYEADGSICGSASDADCDAADSCNGAGSCIDRKKAAGIVCLAGAGVCDPDDTCDGTTNACSATFAASDAPCGDTDNTACNAPDSCSGAGDCVDRKKAAGAVCLLGTGTCDPDDTCDGFTNSCAVLLAASDTSCNRDASECTVDRCDGLGQCEFRANLDCNDHDLCSQDSCDDTSGCVNALEPAAQCNTSNGSGNLTIKNAAPADRQITLGWSHGSFPFSALGDPTTGTDFVLCVYDADGGVTELQAAGGATCGADACWDFTGGRSPSGVRYRDRRKPPVHDGVRRIVARASEAGKAKLQLRAQGENVPAITLGAALQYPVTAQVVTSDGKCWQQAFTPADEKSNDAVQFKAIHRAQ